MRLYKILQHFAPFGSHNTRPIFVVEGAQAVGTPAIVGKNHLKFNVRHNNTVLPAIRLIWVIILTASMLVFPISN